MIQFFIKWLLAIAKVEKNKIEFGIYIHENSKRKIMDESTKTFEKIG